MGKQKVSLSRSFVRLLGPFLFLALCGCADARLVHEAPNGGVIAIPMNNNCWPMYYRNRAKHLMNKLCPDGYQIDREEFVWNGKPGPEGHRPYESYFGYTNPDDDRAAYLRKEYWIAFHSAPSDNRKQATDAPPKPGRSAPAALPPSSSDGERGDELPPPRPLTAN